METIKSASIFICVCVLFAFNLKLYSDKQGVLLATLKEPDGWHVKCRYFTPFHVYYTKQSVQLGCSEYAPVD